MADKLRVTQVKSTISHIARNRATIRALGLHGIGSRVDVADNEATRGMIRQVRFLVAVEEVGSEPVAGGASAGRGGGVPARERSSSVRERASGDASDRTGPVGGDAEEKA